MSAKRLAVLVALLAVLAFSSSAQVNEVAGTVGRAFVSTQTITSPGAYYPRLHFGNEEAFAFNYARLWKARGIFGLSGELPVAIYPSMDLSAGTNLIPKSVGALFITPSARASFFVGQAVSPWVSAGGGYGRFWESSQLLFGGANPGPTGTNTGVVQFGAGLDVFPWQVWGFRLEARDFYSGVPDLNVTTNRSRQHNFYVGVGVIRRF